MLIQGRSGATIPAGVPRISSLEMEKKPSYGWLRSVYAQPPGRRPVPRRLAPVVDKRIQTAPEPPTAAMTVLSGWRVQSDHGSLPGMRTASNPYRGFRYPAEVIQQAVWLYHCFSLSLRDVELVLAAHGVVVSYESIRAWGLRFGRLFANELKRRRPRPGDKWFMDEVFVRIHGKLHYLWRAVGQDCQTASKSDPHRLPKVTPFRLPSFGVRCASFGS